MSVKSSIYTYTGIHLKPFICFCIPTRAPHERDQKRPPSVLHLFHRDRESVLKENHWAACLSTIWGRNGTKLIAALSKNESKTEESWIKNIAFGRCTAQTQSIPMLSF